MRAAPLLAASLVVALACGSRGPLDISGPYASADASAEATTPVLDAGPDVFDAGRDAGALINCFSCLQQNCQSQIIQCATDNACRMTLQCAAQSCLSNGSFDPQCLIQKCGGNLGSLAQVVAVTTCVAGKCGSSCLSLLGSFGGMKDVIPADAGP